MNPLPAEVGMLALVCLVTALVGCSKAPTATANHAPTDPPKAPAPGGTELTSSPFLGAWELPAFPYAPTNSSGPLPAANRVREIVTPGFFLCVEFDARSNRMVRAAGGAWRLDGPRRLSTVHFVGGPGLSASLGRTFAAADAAAASPHPGSPAASPPGTSPLCGTWIMESVCYTGDTNFVRAPTNTARIKWVTPGSFAWCEYDLASRHITSGAAGRCAVEGTQTTETLEIIGPEMEAFAGQSLVFTDRVAGDQLHHSGLLDGNFLIQERWRRTGPGQAPPPRERAGLDPAAPQP